MRQLQLFVLHVRLNPDTCYYFSESLKSFTKSYSEFQKYIEQYRIIHENVITTYIIYDFLFKSKMFHSVEGLNNFI